MKNTLTYIGIFIYIATAFSQADQLMGYNDLGITFAQDKNNGTARFTAMGGAFGALGGDLSAIGINPAGTAIFLKTHFAGSVDIRNQKIKSNYYDNETTTDETNTTLSQLGAVFIFNNSNSKWRNTGLGFNYSLSQDFKNHWIATGNNGVATFLDNNINSTNANGQYFENYTSGKNNKFSMTFASEYDQKIAIGASINTHNLHHYQSTYLQDNNTPDSSLPHSKGQLQTYGSGISFGLGMIIKPFNGFRIGASYQTPVWYQLTEEFYNGNVLNGYNYGLKTPGRSTASAAIIVGRFLIVSGDYTYKDYSNIKLDPNQNFGQENNDFKTYLRPTSEVRLGSELRIGFLSLRAGGFYYQTPYKNDEPENNPIGVSAGAGLKMGIMKLDFALEKSYSNGSYDFYPNDNNINPASLDYNTTKMTITAAFNL